MSNVCYIDWYFCVALFATLIVTFLLCRLIGYIVERNEIAAGKWVSVHSGVVSERTYTIKGLKMNGKYEFRVTAKNAAGRKSQPSAPTPPVICKDDLGKLLGGLLCIFLPTKPKFSIL